MFSRFLTLSALAIGSVVITLIAAEKLFVANQRWGFFPERKVRYESTATPYRVDHLNLEYLKDVVPYAEPDDSNEPDDYAKGYTLTGCPVLGRFIDPFWLAANDCKQTAKLVKLRSRRVVYEVQYHFDRHQRRHIPASRPSSSSLLFLGCSFTFGAGVADEEIFPNLITKKLGPAKGFNLGMEGFGSNSVLRLITRGPTDLRLNDISGDHGLVLYTFIDDQVRRFAGSMSWLRIPVFQHDPYYELDGERLVNKGSFISGRTYTTKLLRWLGNSALLSYFKIDFPILGDGVVSQFAQSIVQIKEASEKNFKKSEFVFSIFPGQAQFAKTLVPKLKEKGVRIFDFSGVDVGSQLKGREWLRGHGHPSALMHRFYSDLILHEIQVQGLDFGKDHRVGSL